MEELLWRCIPGDSVSSAQLQNAARSDGVKSFTSLKLGWPQGFVPRPQVGRGWPAASHESTSARCC